MDVLGGAGGKGTWGKLGDELDLPWVDPSDPNYDSDSQEGEDKKVKKKTGGHEIQEGWKTITKDMTKPKLEGTNQVKGNRKQLDEDDQMKTRGARREKEARNERGRDNEEGQN